MSPPAHPEVKGILVALITPFTPDKKEIDFQALDAHINRLIDAGVYGLVPGGSTGGLSILSPGKRKALIEACIKSAAGRVPVVKGSSDLSTERAVDYAVRAAKAGAAATMIVPPPCDASSLDELHAFF